MKAVIKAETRVPPLDLTSKTGNATLILPQARRKIKRSSPFRRKNSKKNATAALFRDARASFFFLFSPTAKTDKTGAPAARVQLSPNVAARSALNFLQRSTTSSATEAPPSLNARKCALPQSIFAFSLARNASSFGFPFVSKTK